MTRSPADVTYVYLVTHGPNNHTDLGDYDHGGGILGIPCVYVWVNEARDAAQRCMERLASPSHPFMSNPVGDVHVVERWTSLHYVVWLERLRILGPI